MNESLRNESEKLARSWMQHEASWLRDYLVSGVEDPRVNVQSILSRHFLIRALCGDTFIELMEQEYRFAAMMNWLLPLAEKAGEADDLEAVLFGLRRGADDVEGIRIPAWAARIYGMLPASVEGILIPNYVERFLNKPQAADSRGSGAAEILDTFSRVWAEVLGSQRSAPGLHRISVLEPACGSANDFRFFHSCGIAPLIDYTGFDLCAKNIENARALFPSMRFATGNVFAIEAPEAAFDCCVVHDLFEHLSFEGLEAAVNEICRVTRHGICAHFFQMDEIPAHVLRPVDEYHWNLLSMAATRELFARNGFQAQVLHIGTFLRELTGCDCTHNPNAYTFLLSRQLASPQRNSA